MHERTGAALVCRTIARIVAAAALAMPPAAGQEGDCGKTARLEVSTGDAAPGDRVSIPILGAVSCEVTGFSCAVGHDNTRLRLVGGRPSDFIAAHAGEDLLFHLTMNDGEGYGAMFVLFDISFPITVTAIPLPPGTPLATLEYEVLPGAAAGPTPLLNRHRLYGFPNPISNIYSAPAGQSPIEPELGDGSVTVLSGSAFRRGDVNGDAAVDLSDPIAILSHLFQGEPPPECPDAGDANDEGVLDLSDAVYLLSYLYLAGSPPPPPFPDAGIDPTADALGDCRGPESNR